MPRNLMVCEDNPGVLDFQDAVYGPISYDVASLFRDAFISWPEERVLDWTVRYWERPGAPACRSMRTSATSTATWNGWACSATSRCWASSPDSTTATANRNTSPTRRASALRASRRRALHRSRRWRACSTNSRARARDRIHVLMRAMILAAGRGERMRPLTDSHAQAAAARGRQAAHRLASRGAGAAGIRDIVVNHAHLGHLIESALGDGKRFGAAIHYSPKTEALETAGGIANALPLLGDAPFA
jgi:hypothetical protein